eukprot:3112032-Pyramimonas_sp.AAC.1
MDVDPCPDGSDVDASDLTPQAVKADIEHQSQAKHDREPTGRTPALNRLRRLATLDAGCC